MNAANALYAPFVGSSNLNGRFNEQFKVYSGHRTAWALLDRCAKMAIFNRAPYKYGHMKQLPDLAETKLLLCAHSVYSFLNAEH